MRGNTIEIVLSRGRIGQTRGLFQYDRGQKLRIKGEVPGVYAVHFSNQELGTSKTMIAEDSLVRIPDEYLQSGEDIHLWVVVTGEDHIETEYHGVINVIPRAQPSDMEPEEEEASVIEQAIEALNTATAATASAMNVIEDTVHSIVQEAIDSGEFDGFTPTITLEQQGDDTTITVIGKDDTQSATIHQNDPLKMIDDTAGNGVTNKVWSADKCSDQLDLKAPRQNPNFGGSMNMGRAGGTLVGAGSTALGNQVTASGDYSHAEGANTIASGLNAHAEGLGTIASKANQHTTGKYNVEDTQSGGKYAEIVGNGSSNNARSNARALDWQGNEYLSGDVYVNCGNDSTGGSKLQTASEVSAAIAEAIGEISSFDVQIVEELPSSRNSHTIYFVPAGSPATGNIYNEYMWINNKWELIGNTAVDMDIIDDTAGEGDTDKAWSADKLVAELGFKADKHNPVFTGTFSNGRRVGGDVGAGSFAFGYDVVAGHPYAHAEGYRTEALDYYTHAEGVATIANNNAAHAEGSGTRAYGVASHAEGGRGSNYNTRIINNTTYYYGAYGYYSHSEGQNTIAAGQNSHAEGDGSAAINTNAHAEGMGTTASGVQSHAEGGGTVASGSQSHAEGGGTHAVGDNSHAEGGGTYANGVQSHAEGGGTTASGVQSHAEGIGTVASGANSHSGGTYTIAKGYSSHVFGAYNIPNSYDDWPEWTANTHYYVGNRVKKTYTDTVAGYICNTENTDSTLDLSKWDALDGRADYVEIVGNGTSSNNRSNAYALDWDGNGHFKGDVYVGCNPDGTGGTKLGSVVFATDEEIQAIIDAWEVSA